MPRTNYPTAGDLRAALLAAGLTPSADLEGQLWSMAPAGVAAFERQVRRRMLAGTATSILYPPPLNHEGLLSIQDLASTDEAGAPLVPTVTYQPSGSPSTTYAATTDYLLEPLEAAGRGWPYTRVRFRRHDWRSPTSWVTQRAITITGRWGYGTLLPDDAWLAMRNMSLMEALEVNLFGLRGGLIRWTQQGVTEEYANKLGAVWQGAIDRAVSAYRRVSIG